MPVHKDIKSDFFDRWNPQMAYVLGFIFADGYVHENKRGSRYLGFVSTDPEIIEKIRSVLGSSHKISKRTSKKKEWKDQYRLQIGNQHIWATLANYGVVQNKSLIMRLPKGIPVLCHGDFLRGYFDGDGCIYFKQHQPKDRPRPRWVLQCKFVSGSRAFLSDIHALLARYIKGGFIVRKKRGFELCFSHNDSRALYLLMYKNIKAKVFMERKYKKFTHAMKTLNLLRSLRTLV